MKWQPCDEEESGDNCQSQNEPALSFNRQSAAPPTIAQLELTSPYFVPDRGVSDKHDNEGKRQCEHHVVKEDGELHNLVSLQNAQ